MLEVRDLECIRGDHLLFSGLSFQLKAGEVLHVRGKNGSGKTSLLRMLSGLTSPAEGEILWQGESISRLGDDYHARMTYLGHLNGVKGDLTAYENLKINCALSGLSPSEDELFQALADTGLEGREDLPTKVLSQGQKRRVALAHLLLSQAELWILDEPYVALDVDAVARLRDRISTHVAAQGMVVITTHQDVTMRDVTVREIFMDRFGGEALV